MAWVALTMVVAASVLGLSVSKDNPLRPVVDTSYGQVRGLRTFVTNEQIPVDKYFGIPYAQAPIGDLRFRAPEPLESWDGVRNATELPPACYHRVKPTGFRGEDVWLPTVNMSEDCLYLNIWVPRNIQRPMSQLTTLFWIYGGGFYSGSSDLEFYDGTYLAVKQNVIVVSFNYRIGSFGFLNLGVPSASGNAGLLDQTMALNWTFENIENFGGDRNKITIFGESAGSFSVGYHLLSPLSHDLFSSAIMQSGSVLSDAAFQSVEMSLENGNLLAAELGCESDDAESAVDCLREKEASEIITPLNLKFKPTVDGEFLTDSPERLVRNREFKKCNILLGFNTDEQTYFMSAFRPDIFGHDKSAEPKLNVSDIPRLVHEVTVSSKPLYPDNNVAVESLMQTYVKSIPSDRRNPTFKILDDIVGDVDFKCPILELARAYLAENLAVYLYEFRYRSPTNPWPEWMGTMHGYEIEFVFGRPYDPAAGYSREDRRISDIVMSYWNNFASTGDPNSQSSGPSYWPTFTQDDQRYKFLSSSLQTRQYPRYRQCAYWTQFVPVLKIQSESIAEELAKCGSCRKQGTAFTVVVMCVVSLALTFNMGQKTVGL